MLYLLENPVKKVSHPGVRVYHVHAKIRIMRIARVGSLIRCPHCTLPQRRFPSSPSYPCPPGGWFYSDRVRGVIGISTASRGSVITRAFRKPLAACGFSPLYKLGNYVWIVERQTPQRANPPDNSFLPVVGSLAAATCFNRYRLCGALLRAIPLSCDVK